MTRLSSISTHDIWVECHCGHHASLSVAELLQRLPPETTVDQVVAATRCSACGRRDNLKNMRLTFKHGI
jgi:hypothetical protein